MRFDGRGLIKIRDKKSPDLAYRLFLKQLGDDENHTALKTALVIVGTPQAEKFLAFLFNPRKRKTPIEVLAKQCGIGIPQLREIWRTARLDQGMMALLNAYPKAMEDVAKDSRSTREACKFCSGSGRIVDENAPQRVERPRLIHRKKREEVAEPEPVLISCHSCRGRGWVRKSGDKEARALMGQILGVSGKPAPLFASNVTNISVESVINEIEQMGGSGSQRKATGIYEGTAEPVA